MIRGETTMNWIIKAAIIISIGFLIDGVLYKKIIKLEKQADHGQEEWDDKSYDGRNEKN